MYVRLSFAMALCMLAAGQVERAAGVARWQDDATRIVHLRDGSVVRVAVAEGQFKFLPALAAKGVPASEFAWTEVRALQLAQVPESPERAQAIEAVRELGSDDAAKRDAAVARLVELGPGVRPLVESITDPRLAEVRKSILAQLAQSKSVSATAGSWWDELELADGRRRVGRWQGEVLTGNWQQGLRLQLPRTQIVRISAKQPDGTAANGGAISTARIAADKDELFPQQVTRISFETDLEGKPLELGADVSRTFAGAGVLLETSVKSSVVSVNTYLVQSRSQGKSCATHQPLFTGEITIRFCVPGKPEVPAAVTHVGLWIAHVFPKGTTLEAYDGRGRKIAALPTVSNTGHDFLALRSQLPIHRLRIVPNLQIDPNYTFDDLTFDTPRPLAELGSADRFLVRLESGERVTCGDLQLADGMLQLAELGIGPRTYALPLEAVREILTPYDRWRAAEQPADCWLLLPDGSQLRAIVEGEPICPRLPKLLVNHETVAALWGLHSAYALPPEDRRVPPGGALVRGENGKFTLVEECSFGRLGLVAMTGELPNLPNYWQSPICWFQQPPSMRQTQGRVHLVGGESIVIASPQRQIVRIDAAGIKLRVAGEEIEIPSAEILSVTLPANSARP